MSIGTRAMFANYAALQTTGNNIANANTAGYSRQKVELATAVGQFTGAGFFGKGVDVDDRERARTSDFLTREAATTASLAAADDARSSQLQQLENVFPTGEAGLGYAARQMFNAFVDVAEQAAGLVGAPGGAGARRRAGDALSRAPATSSTRCRPA